MFSDLDFFIKRIKPNELRKLTGEGDDGGINEDNLNDSINSADSLILTYIPALKDVPEESVPVIVKQWSYDIAVFYLHDRIQYSDIPERVRDKYDATLSSLKDIAAGRAHLDLPVNENIESGGVDYETNYPKFRRNSF